jgi:phage FluMu protein Com
MKCPKCKTGNDLQMSRSGNQALSALHRLWCVAVRCHSCGNLFHVTKIEARGLGEMNVKRQKPYSRPTAA